MALVITAADRFAFKRCRRAWDFGSRLRQGWEPDDDTVAVDFGAATRAALAIWYFPGMWEWDRAIVRPLALEAYHRVVAGWPSDAASVAELGERLLARYFDWAPSVDRFTPVRVETDFEVAVPDPADPIRDLAAADGSPVHFAGRIELLVVDGFNAYWLVDHRMGDRFADVDELLLDEAGSTSCWAWERHYIGMEIAGVIYNELRTDGDFDAAPVEARPPGPGAVSPVGHRRMYVKRADAVVPEITREGNSVFRRTRVSRGLVELERVRQKLGAEARDMTGAGLAVYPAPSWAVCSTCAFRPPCIALDTSTDVEAVLAASYRRRPPVEIVEGRLGGVTWSIGRGAAPPKFGHRPREGP